MATSKKKDDRSRAFRFLVYPDTMNQDWIQRLGEYQIPTWVSPLHEPDPEEETTEVDGVELVFQHQKKPHYHVVMNFAGKKSPESVKEIAHDIWGEGCCFPPADKFPVHSLEGSVRYMIHADNPEKQQFMGPQEIQTFFGADANIHFLRNIDVIAVCKEIEKWLTANGIRYFWSLVSYAAECRPDWHIVLTQKFTIFFVNYMKSLASVPAYEIDAVNLLIQANKDGVDLTLDEEIWDSLVKNYNKDYELQELDNWKGIGKK